MGKTETLSALPGVLLPWYREHRRCLPWREDRNPYHIWLSEIMLQQTRVEAVKGYYPRFLAASRAVTSCRVWGRSMGEGSLRSRETTRSTFPSTAGTGRL